MTGRSTSVPTAGAGKYPDDTRLATRSNDTCDGGAPQRRPGAVTLTAPGIPIVYYGTEQYLHNDTNGGGDPYSRLMMAGFDQATTAHALITRLGALRHGNLALAYGTYRPRWINDDVYVFERNLHGTSTRCRALAPVWPTTGGSRRGRGAGVPMG